MAFFKAVKRVYLVLMLYLASTSSFARSETDLQINSRTINTTLPGNAVSLIDPRDPPFLANVLRGLAIARTLVGHPIALVEILTIVPSGHSSSNVGDFTRILLSVYVQITEEIAVLRSSQPWGNWEQTFCTLRTVIPGVDRAIPFVRIAHYDQINAFNALPPGLGPWYVVLLRVEAIRPHVSGPIWHFSNPQIRRCTYAFLLPDGSWYVGGEPVWRCAWLRTPGNVSVPQAFSLGGAYNNVTSSSPSSSNLPLSTAGSNSSEVTLPTQDHDSIHETNEDLGLGVTS